MGFKLLWLFVFPFLVTAKVDDCIDERKREWSGEKRLLGYKLSCEDNGVLVGLNVMAGMGTCEDSTCKGLTPYLIEEEHNCYWQNYCTVRVPNNSPIDIIVKTNDNRCTAEPPTYLKISDVECFVRSDKKKIIDYSSLFPKGNCESYADFDRAIIRSHSFYPLDYEGLSRVFDPGEYCVEFYTNNSQPPLQTVVTVKDFDMDDEDYLSLGATGSASPYRIDSAAIGKSFRYSVAFKAPGIEIASGIQLKMTISKSSIGGRGFLLCVANFLTTVSDPDACAEVVSKGVKNSMYQDKEVSDVPVISTATPETCGVCRKQCKKVSKKERKKCRKGCKPPKCTKGRKKDKKQRKGKKNRKSKRGA